MLAAGVSLALAQDRPPRPAPPGIAARAGPDFVLTRKGDDHLGELMVTGFRMRTGIGDLVFPRQAVAQVVMARTPGGHDVLTTADGERVSGRLEGGYVRMSRTAFVPIDLALADVAEIALTPRPEDLQRPLPGFAVALRNGDALRGDPLSPALTLLTAAGRVATPLASVRHADIEMLDDAPHARLVLRDGERRHGRLAEAALVMTTRAGQEIHVPLAMIAALGQPPYDASAVELGMAPVFEPSAPRPRALRDRLRSGGTGPDMVRVPGGKYRRGDLHGDGDADELPVRAVTIGREFALGRYAVTFDEFDLFCERTGRAKPSDEGMGRGRRPVVNVSWNDAAAYVQWLSRETGERYRLPSNAEFEHAARGGRESRFPWGDELGRDNANCGGCGSLWDARRTSPVGRFAPNAFGLYDMAGNVWQWVQDCWDADYRANPGDGSAYAVGGHCHRKVTRGGSWNSPAREVRVANRWHELTARTSGDTGFRVARNIQ